MTTTLAAPPSAALIRCLKSFNQIQEQVEQPDHDHKGKVPSVLWTDELGRLRVWAANIGAHQTGQSSLEFRLRDASHISQQITRLLEDLTQILKDVLEELSGMKTEPVEDNTNSDSWPDENPTSELQQLFEEVVNIIDCLYQMSMLIRKPAQHDLLIGSHKSDAAAFEPFDRDHVRNKYSQADDGIVHRLGHAITQRRKYLKYRDRHHAKLGKGIEEAQGIQRRVTESLMSETIATDFKNPNINFEETTSNSGISQTSYAPSLMDGGAITIPSPPKESAAGKPFECPYCFFVIDIKGTRSWTRHIFKDIKPYVCIFSSCSTPDRLYDSRREWFSHTTINHQWNESVCALCKDTLKTTKQFERHVARHLEELALFALPRTEIEDGDDEEEKEPNDSLFLSEDNAALDGHDSDSSDDNGEEADEVADADGWNFDDPPVGHESLPGITNRTGTEGESGFHDDRSTGSLAGIGDSSSDLAESDDGGGSNTSGFTKRLEVKKALKTYNPFNDQGTLETGPPPPLPPPQGYFRMPDETSEDGEYDYERRIRDIPEDAEDNVPPPLPLPRNIDELKEDGEYYYERRVREIPEDAEDNVENSVDTMANHRTERGRQRSSRDYSDFDHETNMRKLQELERKEEEAQKLERLEQIMLLNEARTKKAIEEEHYALQFQRTEKLEELAKTEEEDLGIERREGSLLMNKSRRVNKMEEKEEAEKAKTEAINEEYYDPEYERKMKKLEELERKEEANLEEERQEEQSLLMEARKARKKKEEEEELKKKAIEEYSVAKREERNEKASKEGEQGLERPTYVKVHKKHMTPETLIAFDLPWEYDQRDSNYLIIKRWVPEHEQDILFEHSRKLRERKRKSRFPVLAASNGSMETGGQGRPP